MSTKKINTHLLTIRPLLLFHIAAREQSFTRAARVLNISQSAVSHGVKALEERLGSALFKRLPTGVSLTPVGEKLAKRLQRGFSEIEMGLEEAYAAEHTQPQVTIMVSTSLASHWLMPRIASFKHLHPGIQLRCITQDTDQDIHNANFDLCIPLGQVPWQGYNRWKLTDEVLFPIYSPDYLATHGPLDTPADLAVKPRIHLEERYTPRYNWSRYFAHFDQSTQVNAADVTFNDYSIVVQAALEGQGIALGWRHIVQPLIDQGRLLAATELSIQTNHPFYVLAPENKPMHRGVTVLRDWLLAEMSAMA